LDESLQEGRIRAALEAGWPLPLPDSARLVHGDFWPGNILWREGRLAAVIDWEDAEVGNPLYDLAVSRLDMLWIFGEQAMAAFTRRYQQEAGLGAASYTQLPYWDLFAALRPAGRIDEWAEGWPQLGRADVTEASMRARHAWFVAQAFSALAG
jgi:aminoglycoside phosphotransferase (APT) family kinase protein